MEENPYFGLVWVRDEFQMGPCGRFDKLPEEKSWVQEKETQKVGLTDTLLSGFAALPGSGDTCLLALPWNRSILLSD